MTKEIIEYYKNLYKDNPKKRIIKSHTTKRYGELNIKNHDKKYE